MYRYEELDYNQIMNDSEIDPNSGDAYYALAQCYRLGKGIAPDMEMYEEYLGYAAEEGHEEATRELAGLEQAGTASVSEELTVIASESRPQPIVSERTEGEDLSSLPMAELRRRADAGNAEACFYLYEICMDLKQNSQAGHYLRLAAECAERGAVDRQMGQKIYLTRGEYLKEQKDVQGSLRAYEMAAEIGSAKACQYLSECYRNGAGCKKDLALAENYRRKAARYGTLADRYQLAVTYMNENDSLTALELLEQIVAEAPQGDRLYYMSRILLGRMGVKRYPRDGMLEELWMLAQDPSDKQMFKMVKKELTDLYKNGPSSQNLPQNLYAALDPDRGYLMGTWRKEADPVKAKQWFAWASIGNAKAKEALSVMAVEEEERKRQKEIEDEQKRIAAAALAEKKKIEAEEKKKKKEKEAAEKAERDRLAAIEAEKRRLEKEEQDRRDRIEAEARAMVLREEREKERIRQKEIAAAQAAQQRLLREQEAARAEAIRRENEIMLQQRRKEQTNTYARQFAGYVLICGAWAVIGLFAALLTLNGNGGAYDFCQLFGSVGTLVWGCLVYRMRNCVKQMKKQYDLEIYRREIKGKLSFQQFLMIVIGLIWILNGMIAENVSWLGFFGAALGIVIQVLILSWILVKAFGWYPLEGVFVWLAADDE